MMRGVWTVARRELRGYFDQPTAYVLAVAFLGLSLFLAFRNLLASGVATLRPLFDLLPVLFAVFVPAATMRTLAEEKRGGTLEWLLAQPLTEVQVILGKFLGDWFFVLIALAGTLPTAIALLLISDADPGIVIAQYLGAAFLAAQLVALGIWASSVTRNQITAFILAAALSFTLFLIGLPVVQIGLPPLFSGALARLSVVSHFQNVARGVVDLRDVLYFLTTAVLFLVLTGAVLGRERLSHAKADYKRLRLGTATVALLVLVLNLLGGHIHGRLDLTRERLYTLAEGTRDLLGNLDDLVQVKLFASRELPPEIQLQLRDVRDILSDFRRASNGHLVVTELNPDDDEDAADEASSMGIYPIEFNVLRNDEFQVKRGYYGMALTYADERKTIPLIEQTADLEFRLASMISSMTRTEKPGVAWATGYGAKASYDFPSLSDDLRERYTLRTISLEGDSVPPISPDSNKVLVIAGPTRKLEAPALERIEEFLEAGGAALILLEPVELDPQNPMPVPVTSGLESLLEDRGVRFNSSLVVDLASSERVSLGRRGFFNVISPYPLWPIALPAGDHAVTKGLNALTLGWAGSLESSDSIHVTPLWQTTEAGGLRDPGSPIMPDQDWSLPEDQLGVRWVAAAIDPGASPQSDGEGEEAGADSIPPGRIIVVADETFLEAQFANSNPQNPLFAANAIDWLAEDESLIRIRSKDRTPPALVLQSDLGKGAFKWGNLVGVPVLFVLIGILRVTGRRRRAEARWKEVVS